MPQAVRRMSRSSVRVIGMPEKFEPVRMPGKQRRLNCFLVVLAKRNQQDLAIFLIVFIYSTRACWIWDDYSQLDTEHLVGYLSSHIQHALWKGGRINLSTFRETTQTETRFVCFCTPMRFRTSLVYKKQQTVFPSVSFHETCSGLFCHDESETEERKKGERRGK